MTLFSIIDLISSLTVIAGVIFGLLEFRNFKSARKREAALTLMQSFMSPEYNAVIPIVFDMPEGLSPDEIVKEMGGKANIFNFLSTFESLGVLVFHREISLDLADDYFSSPTLAAWRKLSPYILDWREKNQRPVGWEWVEWLHDQMAKRESKASPIPAQIAHKDWKPK
jgi:hypothetical protein